MRVKDAIELLKTFNPEYSLVAKQDSSYWYGHLIERFKVVESANGPMVELVTGQKIVIKE
ncbi:hypothetical protein LCGC14_2804140 [marine sediment metagenome]|uniref:Uncharacterized protein n=1 Tax=marine sediment metagenome TaxID=412755 RepID=A0A0F8YLX1_9ZZZZ